MLLLQVEANTHAIIILAKIANGRNGGVSAERSHGLDKRQQLFRLEKHADASAVTCGITIEREQESLHLQGARLLIEGVLATPALAIYLSGERSVCVEGDVRVAALEAQLCVFILQLLLNLRGNDLSTSARKCVI